MEILNNNVVNKPRIFPWYIIRASILITLYVPFSHWAINAEALGKYDLGWSIVFGFTHVIAFVGSIAMAFMSLMLSIFYNVNNKKGDDTLLYAFFISIAPVTYVIITGIINDIAA